MGTKQAKSSKKAKVKGTKAKGTKAKSSKKATKKAKSTKKAKGTTTSGAGKLPKKRCCESRPRCSRCPLRMLKEGTLPEGYAVKKRRLVKVGSEQCPGEGHGKGPGKGPGESPGKGGGKEQAA